MVTRETDYIQQLANYIKRNLSKGYTSDSLKWALVDQGHSRTEIERAIKLANEQLALQAPKMIERPVIKVHVNEDVVAEPETGFWAKVKSWFR